ncbi:MAG: alpha/beta fold hydrolase [Nitriliruptoraceae bacterium]
MLHRDWGERDPAWAGIRSEILHVAGTPVHVLRADGPAQGPTQVLVHGLGGTALNWLEVIAPLSARGPVLAPDLPGFGRTQPPRARASRIDHNLGFLRALLRAEGLTRVEVHGNSMGGMLATLLAAAEPRFVTRLVLVNPALAGPTSRLRELDPDTLRTFGPFTVPGLGERQMARWYARSTPRALVEENAAFVHADPGRIRPALTEVLIGNAEYALRHPWRIESFSAAASSLVRMLLQRRRLDAALAAVSAPILLLWGGADRLVGRPVIERTRAKRPDLTYVELEGVGHAPMMEVPDRYVAAVTAWLAAGTTSAA